MSNTPLPDPVAIADGTFNCNAQLGTELFREDQMHAHAAAVSADKDARIKVLEEALWAADLAFAEHGILAVHATRMQVRAALGDKT